MMAMQSRRASLRATRTTTIRATLTSPRLTDDDVMKSIKQLQAEEDERRRVFAAKIKQLKAREAGRLAKVAENVKLADYAITDAELTAGLRHAIELALEREKREGSDDESSVAADPVAESATSSAAESATESHAVGA